MVRKKRTTADFISEMNTINPNIQILGEYTGTNNHIKVKCLVCGHEWFPFATTLLSGHGCPKCAGHLKRTHKSFVEELKDANPSVEVLGTYKDSRTKIMCRCKICGYEWPVEPNALLRGHGCPEFRKHKDYKPSNRKTTAQFIKEMAILHPTIKVLGEYKTVTDNILCECMICGHKWAPQARTLLLGHGCPKYQRHPGHIPARLKTTDQFIKELETVNTDIQIVGEYKGANEPIKAKCLICGYEWEPYPTNLLKGHGCPNCIGHAPKAHAAFIEEMAEINPNIEVLGKYKSADTTIRCRCKNCGHEWEPKPNHLLAKHGCPKCAQHLQTSFPEQAIFYYIRNAFPDAVAGDTSNGFELDVYIPSIKTAIEYDGFFWHKGTLDRDNQKDKNCRNTGIRMIRVREKTLPKTVHADCIQRRDLSEDGLATAIKEVFELLDIPGIDIDIQRDSKAIGEQYASKSLTQVFIEKISEKNPKIEVIDDYINATTRIWVKCKKCGHKWKATPHNLLNGTGCAKCAKQYRRSHEEFVQELFEINPNISVIGHFVNTGTKVMCHCNKCGYEWPATPDHLLHGEGCPKCAGTMKKSHEQFVEELKEKRPEIQALDEYKNAKTRIRFHCLKCGHLWLAAPTSILSGSGCPKCAGKVKRTQAEFIKELRQKNANIEVLGTYVNATTKVNFRCKICGHEWSAVPNSVLRGSGCPNWRKHDKIK